MIFSHLKKYTVLAYLFLIPFVMYTGVQDVFMIPKWFFTASAVGILLMVSILEFIFTKKIRWEHEEFDSSVVLFVVAAAVSLIIGSINKIQALLTVQFGFITFVFLGLLYYYVSRQHIGRKTVFYVLYAVGIVFSLITFVSYVDKLTKLLPSSVSSFLAFNTTAGNPAETLIVLGFVWSVILGSVLEVRNDWKQMALSMGGLLITSVAGVMVSLSIITQKTVLVLPSYSHSWYVVLEALKNPITALFGFGMGTFSSVFPRVKDAEFLASSYWQLSTFTFSRTFFFQVVSELGLLGAAAFVLMLFTFLKRVFTTERGHIDRIVALYFVGAFFLAPPTYLLIVMFFVWAGYSMQKKDGKDTIVHFSEIPAMHVGLILISLLAIGGSVFGLSRVFRAEKLYKDSLSTTNLKSAYDLMRQAVMQNPYDERIRTGFVGVHMLVANTIAEKTQQAEGKQMSEQDKQTITQAIQSAIEEAKAVVTLNPRKASNWDLLATVYKNILPLAQGADAWALSAYQRAVLLDPQNPTYRLALGGVYYQLKQYDEAMRSFEQAAALKTDWPNAQYNYAWSAYQKGDYQRAVLAMQSTVALIDPKRNEADYKKAQADLEEFKKKVPENTQTTQQKNQPEQKGTLALPPAADAGLDEKISLPQSASPEAK